MELFPLYPLNLYKLFPFLAQLIFEINALCIYDSRFVFTHILLQVSLHFLLLMFFIYNVPSTHYKNSVFPVCFRVQIYIYLYIYIHFMCFCDILYYYQTKSPNFVSQILPLHTNIYLFYYGCCNYLNKTAAVSQCVTFQNLPQVLCCHAFSSQYEFLPVPIQIQLMCSVRKEKLSLEGTRSVFPNR